MRRSWPPWLFPPAVLAGMLALLPATAQPVPTAATPVGGPAAAKPAAPSDAEALKQAGLSPTDAERLTTYLEQRTLTDVDQGKVRGIIRRMGADDFDARQAASRDVEVFGSAALGPLRDAERDADPEVAFRAKEALKRLNKIRHEVVAAAAVRAMVRLKPPQASRVLLGFLPVAGDEQLAEEIRAALVGLAVRDGKADPAITAAVADPIPVRRSAAYVALIEGGAAEALPKVREAVRGEADPDARFAGLWAFVRVLKDRDAIPELIGLVPRLGRGRIWQLEDLLLQLAEKDRPGVHFGRGPEALAKARDGWLAWYAKHGGALDLARFDYRPRVLGYTDLVEMDPRGFGNWRITAVGPDDKERWRITGLANPTDAHTLPNGRVLVAEMNGGQVSERDTAGKELFAKKLTMPLTAAPLPGGGVLVACRNEIHGFDKDWKEVLGYTRPRAIHDIVGARRLSNGDTVFLVHSVPGENCIRINAKGETVGKIQVGRVHAVFAGLDVTPDDKVLVTEYARVVEYDLTTGKAGWSYAIANPTSVQRLPNGNTLVASSEANKAVEVDPAGEVVWEFPAHEGLKMLRAYRR